jgi:hypothetical protein
VASTPVAGQQLLQNGGYEQGSSGWNGPGLSTDGCAAHSGDSAISVPLFIQQNLPAPIGSGAYRLDGWLGAQTGNPTVEVTLIWFDDEASALSIASREVVAGAGYAPFSFSANAPAGAQGLRVRLVSEDGAFCLDDVTLDGPAPPVATPAPTQPAVVATATSVATTRPPASATPRPTATTQAAADPADSSLPPAFEFTNGGFEAGLAGWSKFGGTLSMVQTPVHSGGFAGRLSSATDSTKWAYQTLVVDPAQHYEFSGYVSGDAGVQAAYLRISWYASNDGSGAALATTDSTSRISGASAYALLATGPVQAPVGARSARTRVVLTPSSAGPASITFDDLWFGAVAAPELAPDPSPARETGAATTGEAATERRDAPPNVAPSLPPTGTNRSNPTGQAGGATALSPAIATPASDVAPGALPSGALAVTPNEGRRVPFVWLAGAALFLAGLAGSYLHARRRSA